MHEFPRVLQGQREAHRVPHGRGAQHWYVPVLLATETIFPNLCPTTVKKLAKLQFTFPTGAPTFPLFFLVWDACCIRYSILSSLYRKKDDLSSSPEEAHKDKTDKSFVRSQYARTVQYYTVERERKVGKQSQFNGQGSIHHLPSLFLFPFSLLLVTWERGSISRERAGKKKKKEKTERVSGYILFGLSICLYLPYYMVHIVSSQHY